MTTLRRRARTVSMMARVTCTLSAHYVQFSPAPSKPLEKSAFIPEIAYNRRNTLYYAIPK